MTEEEMRNAPSAWPQTIEELTTYINGLVEQQHDYGTCVYAASLSAVATMHYIAFRLGMTGFQMSCADMDVVRRMRGYKHGVMVIDFGRLLYPQYDIIKEVCEAVAEAKTSEYLQKAARDLLMDKSHAHPDVIAHWETLAGPLNG